MLHARQHLGQRELQRLRQLPAPGLLEPRLQHRRQRLHRRGLGRQPAPARRRLPILVAGVQEVALCRTVRGLRGLALQLRVEVAAHDVLERVAAAGAGVQQVGGDLEIAAHAAQPGAVAEHGAVERLGLVHHLGGVPVRQHFVRPRGHLQRQHPDLAGPRAQRRHAAVHVVPGHRHRVGLGDVRAGSPPGDGRRPDHRLLRGLRLRRQRQEPLVQRTELQRGEQLAHRLRIPRPAHEQALVGLQRHVVQQPPELAVELHLVGALLDALADLRGQLGGGAR